MFDKLVESTNVRPQGRSKFYIAISAIYGVSLMALGILTIMWFNPMPAEAYERIGMIAPPPPMAPRPVEVIMQRAAVAPRNLAPTSIPKEFINPLLVKPAPPVTRNVHTIVGGLENNSNVQVAPPAYIGNGSADEAPMPIPTPKTTPAPTPRPEPITTPTPSKPKTVVSDMLPSKAIKKIQPPYPAIARSARVQGSVTVQVLISEEGRVVSASTVNGHPLLLDASLQAARQWVFSPTTLNGQAVKVSGVLTFNFTLN
jgi:periplasmic protein TonB